MVVAAAGSRTQRRELCPLYIRRVFFTCFFTSLAPSLRTVSKTSRHRRRPQVPFQIGVHTPPIDALQIHRQCGHFRAGPAAGQQRNASKASVASCMAAVGCSA